MILLDTAQRNLDDARAVYRQQYDRGYMLSMRGQAEKAQEILDKANATLRRAEVEYDEARAAQ